MTKFNPDQILFEHCCATMPDSISGRRQILRALQCSISEKHPASKNIAAQLAALDTIEALQSQLPFQKEATA